MLTLSELKGAVPDCPPLDPDQFRQLWVTDFDVEPWTGVRSGMLLYRGAQCAYQIIARLEEKYVIRQQFAVLRLSHDQVAAELEWHEQHKMRVGGGKTVDWHIEEYRQRNKPDYSGCEVLGWFEV